MAWKISISQINMAVKCFEQWRRRYKCGDIIPPAIALHRGSSYHKGAEHNFKQKISSGIDLPQKQIEEVAIGSMETAIDKEGLFIPPEDKLIGKANIIETAISELRIGTKLYSDVVAPSISPLYVEETITIPIDDETEMTGRLDLICALHCIRDLKLTGKSMNQDEVDKSPQMTMYDLLYKAKYGNPATGISIHNTVLKKSPEVQVLTSTRKQDDHIALMENVLAVLKAIKAEAYTYAYGQMGAWWCSPRFCGYWQTCKGVPKYKR